MHGTRSTGLSPNLTSEFVTTRPMFFIECFSSNCLLSCSNWRNFAVFVCSKRASYDGCWGLVLRLDGGLRCECREQLRTDETVEHANELRALHCDQCLYTFRGQHGMDEVQIDAGSKVRRPAINAVVLRIVILTEPRFVLAGFDGAMGMG